MRTVLAALALALAMGGCTSVQGPDDMLREVPDGGFAIGEPCILDADCASMLCSKVSYDCKPGPICTLACTVGEPAPQCPEQTCNMKGFCRIP